MSAAVEVQGRCDSKFAVVQDAFRANFESGADLSASFAVTLDGELVDDLWGGYHRSGCTAFLFLCHEQDE